MEAKITVEFGILAEKKRIFKMTQRNRIEQHCDNSRYLPKPFSVESLHINQIICLINPNNNENSSLFSTVLRRLFCKKRKSLSVFKPQELPSTIC